MSQHPTMPVSQLSLRRQVFFNINKSFHLRKHCELLDLDIWYLFENWRSDFRHILEPHFSTFSLCLSSISKVMCYLHRQQKGQNPRAVAWRSVPTALMFRTPDLVCLCFQISLLYICIPLPCFLLATEDYSPFLPPHPAYIT